MPRPSIAAYLGEADGTAAIARQCFVQATVANPRMTGDTCSRCIAKEIGAMGKEGGGCAGGCLGKLLVTSQAAGIIDETLPLLPQRYPVDGFRTVNQLDPDIAEAGAPFGNQIMKAIIVRQVAIDAEGLDAGRIVAAVQVPLVRGLGRLSARPVRSAAAVS